MGKYGIGVRVRDPDGDLAEIVGKPGKGLREVRLIGGKCDGMLLEYRKSSLEVVDDHFEGITAMLGGIASTLSDGISFVAEVPPASSCAEKCEVAFSVGQRVVCVDGYEGQYTQGSVYVVRDVYWECGDYRIGTEVDDRGSTTNGWGAKHFRPFTLEAGKFYRTRDGKKVGPMERRAGYFSSSGMHYANNGISAYMGRLPADYPREEYDIVAEWVEPAVVEDAPTAFTVVAGKRYRGKSGAEYDVVDNSGNEFWPLKAPGGKRFWKVDGTAWDGRLGVTDCPAGDDLVAIAKLQTKFKVGDRVRHVNLGYVGTVEAVLDFDHVMTFWPSHGWGATDPITELELVSSAPLPAVGAKVTLTATVTGHNPVDRHNINVVVDGLPAGRNSFGIPPSALSIAA